ncbi:hypothetical protein [Marinomonas spartinae]|uniref:hypothetical protein n=1 Tax=Marinomonas spartinae TaxID=1792290 RepID=UPI0018F26767|nr:hypothetical protein [Marinomonas spartinae]MBJ7556675.1 hypothetical protein [Marinomonas spartinae]
MPNRSNVKIKEGLAQVIGRDPGGILYVLLILSFISWMIDTSLEIVKDITLLRFQSDLIFNIAALLVSVFGLLVFYIKGKKTSFSEKYDADDFDPNRKRREVLIMPLSNYSDKSGNSFDHLRFSEEIKYLKPENDFSDLWKSKFNCNWLMTLNAICNYPNVHKVILLSTRDEINSEGKENKNSGSFNQVDTFKKFVDRYFHNSTRNIEIVTHLDTKWEIDEDIKSKIQKGIPSDDPRIFAKTCLNIMDTIEKEKKEENPNYLQDKLVIDVTGGKASMSASLAAVSGSKGIFLHYTDTNSKESHTLDINTY